MKKTITLLLLIAASSYTYSQKISEDKIDEFTKKRIVRTDWEKICGTTKLYLNVRINKIDDQNYLQLKFFPKGVSSIDESHDISFMFENGEVINLKSTKYKLANYGDGSIGLVGSKALGFDIDTKLSESDIKNFQSLLISKIRINKSEGYSEDIVKTKNAEKFRNLFLLMYK
jgi:hypothetical protein